ncbi:MAG: hypothetical protein MMC33_003686 [Icmadophila ericetorum]|nr:hypothetical protein [Icmadophila ericetorum]
MSTPETPSTSTPPQPSPSPSATPNPTQYDFQRTKSTLAHTLLITAPILLLLPPRKLDFYTFSLSGIFVLSANEVYRERHAGRGILENLRRRKERVKIKDVPVEIEERPMRNSPGGQAVDGPVLGSTAMQQEEELRRREVHAQKLVRGQEAGVVGMAKKLWMGGEEEGWKERRSREEREALEEGKGYGDLIMDQIWEVWTWGKSKDGGAEGNNGGGEEAPEAGQDGREASGKK